MSTRRERLEAKLEKRQEWAESRDRKAGAAFGRASSIADNIPLGQPILVGHHSEKRARKDQERIQNGMRKGLEHDDMAKHHRGKAAGLAQQLDGTIFTDDPDATEALQERIAGMEEKRDTMKKWNAAHRKAKGDIPKLVAILELTNPEGWVTKLEGERDRHYISPKHWKPFESYSLTNLGANIRRLKKRIEEVTRRQVRQVAVEEAGGVLVERAESCDWCTVTFEEKPEREVLTALRAAGFRWSGGAWNGKASELPEEVEA